MKTKMWVAIEGPRFKSDDAWDFRSESMTAFKAKVLDREFLSKVRNREISFSYGDLLYVELELSSENEILCFAINKVLGQGYDDEDKY